MATEITPGAQSVLESLAKVVDQSRPIEDRFDPHFTDHGSCGGPAMDLSGTHTGEWMGLAPTGKRFTVRDLQVMGLKGGLPVDRWGSTDQLGMMHQLGLIPAQDRHS